MQGEDCKPPVYEDEIDLVDLVKVIWRRRLFIVGGIVISMCLATILVFLLPRVYRSSGFYRLSSVETGKAPFFSFVVSQPEFHVMKACFNNEVAFHGFLKRKGQNWDLEEIIKLKKSIEPVYAFAGNVKGKGRLRVRISAKDYISGVELSVENRSPERAFTLTSFLGEWIRDCVLKDKIRSLVKKSYYKVLGDEERLDETLNKNKNLLVQMENDLKKLEKISGVSTRYLGKNEERQLGVIFMKLSSMQEKVMNLKSEIVSEELSYKRTLVEKDFWSKLVEKVDNTTGISGDRLLDIVLEFERGYFSSMPADSVTRMVKEELTLLFQQLKGYSEELMFIKGPSHPLRPIKPKKRLILALSFIMSLFFFIFMAFILEWWSANKEEFTS